MKKMNSQVILNEIKLALEKIRVEKPLVYQLTNKVALNDSANISLSIGASPVMTQNTNEVEQIVSLSQSLVLNIGTPADNIKEIFIKAVKGANRKNISVILDPVGVGATSLRLNLINILLEETRVSIIRGNLSEIKQILGKSTLAKGVDSLDNNDAERTAVETAKKFGIVTVITGKEDVITDGKIIIYIKNGHSLMSRITGTGCMVTSLIACFAAVCNSLLIAAVGGTLIMGLAGEAAAQKAEGPGSLHWRLFDEVYKISEKKLLDNARIIINTGLEM